MLTVLTHTAVGGVALFSGRLGGVSVGAFAAANVSSRVGDDPAAVRENRQRLVAALGFPTSSVVTVRQRHTATVVEIDSANQGSCLPTVADGMITRRAGLALMIGAADCVPIALLGPGVVGVLHAGRRGILAGIVESGLERVAATGVAPATVTAVVGPAIGGCCYELDDLSHRRFVARYPQSGTDSRRGRAALDLRSAVKADLRSGGVRQVVDAGECTAHDAHRYFSSRRDGLTGHQAGLVALADPAG